MATYIYICTYTFMTAMTHRRGRGHANLLPIDINVSRKRMSIIAHLWRLMG